MAGSVSTLFKNKQRPISLQRHNLGFQVDSESGSVVVYHVTELGMGDRFELQKYLEKMPFTFTHVEPDELRDLIAEDDTSDATDTDVEQLFDEIFNDAAADNASDIHIYSCPDDPHIDFRINGEMTRYKPEVKFRAKKIKRLVTLIYESETGNTGSNKGGFMPIQTQTATVEERLATNGHRYRLRYQDAILDGNEDNIHVTLRLLDLDKNFEKSDLADLGYEEDQQALISDTILKGSGGLIIIVGATGDGKTTTAATILSQQAQYYNGTKNIITVEDPVEFKIPGVNHTQVQPVGKETPEQAWERHLAAILRRDPDFILQGEMRTKNTAECAVHSALTGHVTMVTLHGNSAFDALHRCQELDIPYSLLGASGFIKGIVFQRLLPTLCPHCSIKLKDHKDNLMGLVDRGVATAPLLKRLIGSYGSHLDDVAFRNYQGCDQPRCRKGINGRVAVVELLKMDAQIRILVSQGKIDEAREYWRNAKGTSHVIPPEASIESHYTQHCVGFTAFDHGIKKMLLGQVSPVDVEDKLEPISTSEVMSDGTFSGDEVGVLTGIRKDTEAA